MFVAGAYTATWNSTSIGGTENGFEKRETFLHEPIHADSFGRAHVDGVQEGSDVLITLESIEYDLVQAAVYAQTGSAGAGNANVGKLLSSLAKQLVLTPVTGTTATTAGKTWTFPLAIIVDDVNMLLSRRLRKGPLTFRCFPNYSSGTAYTTA
jgi:hypothetical protein